MGRYKTGVKCGSVDFKKYMHNLSSGENILEYYEANL